MGSVMEKQELNKELHPLSAFQVLYGNYKAQIDWSDMKPNKSQITQAATTFKERGKNPLVGRFKQVKPDYMAKTQSIFFFDKKKKKT